MVEPVVYGGLGFLVACLAFLAVGRALWRRAVRLTTRRLVERLPMSRNDIVAEQDFVRAEAAVQLRALERRAGRLRTEVAEGRIELGRRDAALSRLRGELAAGQTGSAAAEILRAENQELRTERAVARTAETQARSGLDGAKAKLARTETELAELKVAFDVQQVEIAALRTDLANVESDARRRARDAAASQEAAQRSAAERERVLRNQIGRLEAELGEPGSTGGDAAAERAELRGKIEHLASEIARLSALSQPPRPGRPVLPEPAVAMTDGSA